VNIFLIGPMGAGKSTIGKLLAKALGRDFCDSDKEIERRTGVSIPMIFDYEGEAGFRRRESETLARLSERDAAIIATGGGAVLLPENRELLRRRGFVVYLKCSVDKQLERTHKDTNRPLLQTDNPRQRLQDLFAERDPLYSETADLTVDTGVLSGQAAVKRIVSALQQVPAAAVQE
jgi:shikimate kinase